MTKIITLAVLGITLGIASQVQATPYSVLNHASYPKYLDTSMLDSMKITMYPYYLDTTIVKK